MHFAPLILALTAAATASAATVAKRSVYYLTFYNLNGATETPDYLTYKLVPTIYDCLTACDKVTGCNFVNTYHDVNGKGGSPDLTCSMYKTCHYANTAINKGGQTQPSGLLDYITESDGWCRI
ncbi:hypothetical protein F5887DRAFT_1157804 [Amanita rubescens]|nr:hypothetical protein F5887DRAFT_1157804 [Amanita rubescens]